MRTGKLVLSILAALGVSHNSAVAGDRYGFGKIASPDEIAGWNIDIRPDGTNLPPGSGTVAFGRKVFAEKCAMCHGEKGEGGMCDRLVGGIGTLATAHPVKTVGSYWPYATTLFDYIRRAMPLPEPQSLSNQEVYALSAYILNMNGIVPDNGALNAETLRKIKMPNRDNFMLDIRPDTQNKPCMEKCAYKNPAR